MISYVGILYGSLNEDKNGIITTTIKHTFHFDEGESPVDILDEDDLPPRKSQHPAGKGLYALTRSISGPLEGDGAVSGKYVVTIFYTNNLEVNINITGSEDEISPWKLPPYDVSIYPVEVVKSFVKGYSETDKKGSPSVPVLNSAGDQFDAQTVEQNTVIRFSYNLKDFDEAWINQFADTTNNASVTIIDNIIPKQKGRLRNIGATIQKVFEEDGDVKYKFWKVDIEIEKSADIWQVELMQLGFFFLDPPKLAPDDPITSANKRKRIYTDGNGLFGSRDDVILDVITEGKTQTEAEAAVIACDVPQKLAELGEILATGADAEYIKYNNKALVNWESLSLPLTTVA